MAILSQDNPDPYINSARVARLATADAAGRPYVVPVCFAQSGVRIYIALDAKPKRVVPTRLKRVRNILANPYVALLVDTYSEDWTRLRYALVTGTAALAAPGSPDHSAAISLLRDKYPQYLRMPIESQPVITISVTCTYEWQAAPVGSHIPQDRPGLDFALLARGRHVVRRFKTIPVPRELVEAAIEAARWAPSPHGAQPWRFIVLTRPEVKEKLAQAMGAEWRRNLALDGDDPDVVETRARQSHNRIVSTPVLIIPCLYLSDLHTYSDPARQEAERVMAIQSLGAAIQNLLLSAYSLGLDTGWMCAPLFCPEVVVEALALQPDLIPHALIQLGWGAQDPPRRPRRPITDLIMMYE